MGIHNFLKIKLFLFNNIGIKQTFFKNAFWLAIAEGVSRLLKLILIIYIARILGATEYGKFNFAFAFVALFVIFSDFGLSQITTREFAQDKKREKEFSAILSLKIILSLGALFLILISSFFITSDPIIQKVIWILAVVALVGTFFEIIYAFFRARQKMEYEALAKILQALILTTIGFFVILNYPSVENLSYGYLSAGLVALIFILIFFNFKIFPLKFSWQKVIWRRFLMMSWPVGLALIFTTLYGYIDSVMMGYLGQITETGWYNAAYKIVGLTFIPATIIYLSFYPALSIAFKKTKERLQELWNYQMEIMILLAIPLVVGGITLAPRIIDFIYDPSFAPSILALQILIVMAGIVFLCNPFSQVLIISNQQEKSCQIAFSGAIVNIILNLILIPRFSLYGAAFAIVAAWLLMFFLFFKTVSKFTSIKPFSLRFFLIFIIALFSSLLMYFVISQPKIYNLNIFFLLSIGVGIYFPSFLISKKLVSQFSKIFL